MPKVSKISIPEVKKHLKTYKAEELISIIIDCYRSSEDVKKYIHMMLEPEGTEDQLFEEAKKKVLQQFFPERGVAKLKLADAKKAISEFGKLSNNPVRTLELMIYYVELGVEFINVYGYFSEPFYNSMASMFYNVNNKIEADSGRGLYDLFHDELEAIVGESKGVGWGLFEQLCEMFCELARNYEDEDEDEIE
ncbi:DUF6155 family protein [Paenibacillus alba]|uniref:DUF6155 family protein n=1 Tax=Paenibacillus alba TaxID=1197127 RepID=A0ABU6GBK7_9BACL|nr:DUF6155 family protein [Paenibacillus alba]MEC0231010.1 DUF6155 family protein [Paenibacillus alba]